MKNLNLNLLTSNKKEVSNFFNSFKTVAEKEEALKESIRFLLFNFTLFTEKNKKLVFNFIKKYIDQELKFKDFLEFGCDKNTEKVKSFHIEGYEENISKNYEYYINLMLEIDKNYFVGPLHDLRRDFYLIEGLLKIFIDYYNLNDDNINYLLLKLKQSCISCNTRNIEEINIEDKIYFSIGKDKIFLVNIEKYKIFLVKFLKYALDKEKFGVYKNSVNLVILILILIEDDIQFKRLLVYLLKAELDNFVNLRSENIIIKYLFFLISEKNYDFKINQFKKLKLIIKNYNKKYIDFLYIEKDFDFRSEKFPNLLKKVDEIISIPFLKDLIKIIGR